MDDDLLMQRALELARTVLGKTHPNPAVGALIVHGGEVVACGATQQAGAEHAEIWALRQFAEQGFKANASTRLYVTMEPCSTQGRTGACTEAILQSGIPSVVVGTVDPNPKHAGRGLDILREGGLSVQSGILEAECRSLNIIFNYWIQNDLPLMAGKIATTLDGRTATRGGLSKWITGPQARQDVHFWRRAFPAIAVGAGTLLADNPALTIRLDGVAESCGRRFIFDRSLVSFNGELPRVYTDPWKSQTTVVTRMAHAQSAAEIEASHGVKFWFFDDPMTLAGFRAFRQRCAEEGINGVYIEGGAQLLSSFLRARMLDYLFVYRSGKLLADEKGLSPFEGFAPDSMDKTISLKDIRHGVFGDDQLMRGCIHYPAFIEGP